MKKDLSGRADLHVHTTFSDGVFTPAEVVEKALEMGLGAVAITDHDCAEGIPQAIYAARGKPVDVIPGIEISAAAGDNEIHILGYFIDHADTALNETLSKMKENRVERIRNILDLLKKEGFDVDERSVFKDVGSGTIGRMHLARIMVENRFVKNHHEAFDKYLGEGRPCSLRHVRLDFTKAISIIRSAGGVPVLAHPGTMGSDELFPDYVSSGMRGVEAYHIKHHTPEINRYLAIAEKYGLIVTGGSDCHGMASGRMLMGRVTVDIGTVDILKEESRKIRQQGQ
ncbi:MAG: PHP domain-containing protein [Candidatus Omnitrophota bacterium]